MEFLRRSRAVLALRHRLKQAEERWVVIGE
jgi:hypothetical protein